MYFVWCKNIICILNPMPSFGLTTVCYSCWFKQRKINASEANQSMCSIASISKVYYEIWCPIVIRIYIQLHNITIKVES